MPGVRLSSVTRRRIERLVGRLLRVLAEDDDPARVERAVDVVVSAVHVQRVLGERARGHFQDHRRALARRVVILLDAVDDALARGVVDDALAADRVRDRAALGGVLAFGLDGDRVAAEDVQLAFGKRLLVQLAAFGRRRDGIEDAGVGDPGFGVVGNQLVAVGGDTDPRIAGSARHGRIPPDRGHLPRVEVSLRLAVVVARLLGQLSRILPPVSFLAKDFWTPGRHHGIQ